MENLEQLLNNKNITREELKELVLATLDLAEKDWDVVVPKNLRARIEDL